MNDYRLFDAAFANNVELVRSALSKGQSPNCIHDIVGHTPLMVACDMNALGALKELIQAGANVNLRFAVTSRVTGRVQRDRVALMYVKSVEAARMMIEAGADANAADQNSNTSLSIAAIEGFVDVVKYLVSVGAHTKITAKDEEVCIHALVAERISNLLHVKDGIRDTTAASPPQIDRLREIYQLLVGESESKASQQTSGP